MHVRMAPRRMLSLSFISHGVHPSACFGMCRERFEAVVDHDNDHSLTHREVNRFFTPEKNLVDCVNDILTSEEAQTRLKARAAAAAAKGAALFLVPFPTPPFTGRHVQLEVRHPDHRL